jgi:glucose/arabinose dehydrogenase
MRVIRRSALVGPLLCGLALVAGGCSGSPRNDQPAATQTDVQSPPKVEVQAVASGLAAPWALAFAPDGRIFVTEREGRIRVIEKSQLRPEPWAVVDVVQPDYQSEGGLLGIAVALDFEKTRHVFVVGTFALEGRLMNRVLRFTERDGQGVDRTVIVDNLPPVQAKPGEETALHTHLGGALGFGPDGMLYVAMGDATQPPLAQNTASLAGKILRYRPDGTIPSDNPIAGSPVYALGTRNVQGFAWHPDNSGFFLVDHGPGDLTWEKAYGGRSNDELNVVLQPGSNFGWPRLPGIEARNYTEPLMEFSGRFAPAGIAAYSGPYSPWQGSLFVGALRGEHLLRIVVAPDQAGTTGWKVARQEPLLRSVVGRIRAVAMGLDGFLYVASSNRDGRGTARADDDRVYRIIITAQ